MANKEEDHRDIFEKALDYAQNNPEAVVGAVIGGALFRGLKSGKLEKIAANRKWERSGRGLATAYGAGVGGLAGAAYRAEHDRLKKRRKKK